MTRIQILKSLLPDYSAQIKQHCYQNHPEHITDINSQLEAA